MLLSSTDDVSLWQRNPLLNRFKNSHLIKLSLLSSLSFSVRRGLSLYNHLHVRQDSFSLQSKISIAKQIAQVGTF